LALDGVSRALRALPRRGLPFGVGRWLAEPGRRQRLAALPPPRVTFNYLGQLDASFDASGLFELVSTQPGQNQGSETPLGNWLTVTARVSQGRLEVVFSYSREMYEAVTIARLVEGYRTELDALVGHAATAPRALSVADVPLAGLSAEELAALPIERSRVADIYALAPLQRGLLFHALYAGSGSDVYVSQLSTECRGLDLGRFRAAFERAAEQHAILRTAFVAVGGAAGHVQVVYDRVELPVRELDWSDRSVSTEALVELARQERLQGVELDRAPLQRLLVVKLDAGRQRLIWTHHHLLLDGWSQARLMQEVLSHYADAARTHGARAGEGRADEGGAARAGSYRDYIAWLAQRDASRDESFWRGELSRLDEPTLLAGTSRSDAAPSTLPVVDVLARLDAQRSEALVRFARRERITLNTLVQGAWALVLSRYTGQRAVAFGLTVSGRPAGLAGAETAIGLFINSVPLVAEPHATARVADWLRELLEANLRLREHEHTPLGDIQRWAGRSGQPLFDTLFAFENYPIDRALAERGGPGLEFSDVQTADRTHFPLTIEVSAGDTLAVRYKAAPELFTRERVETLACHVAHVLEQLVEAPERALGAIQLATRSELERVQGFNATAQPYRQDLALHEWIEAQVRRTPDAVALVADATRLSYAELDARANQLAHFLRARGIGSDDLVGVCLERSAFMVVSLLGILKAGAAYVPLDPEYPVERLRFMLTDSRVALLIADEKSLGLVEAVAPQAWCIDRQQHELDAYPRERPATPVHVDQLAYCIYTSGSTGKPKGAGNSHRAIVNRLVWMQDEYGLDASDAVLQKTPFSFDVSVWEFFWPLMRGARLVVAPPGAHRDPAALAEQIERHEVTTLHFVPSMLQAFVDARPAARCASVRRVICSGEALSLSLQTEFLRDFGAELHNLYGPTEAAVDVTSWHCRPETDAHSVPIGRPIANIRIYLLDAHGNVAPPGVAGELMIGGVGLARGYHHRPSLTAQRFVPDSVSGEPGARLYRTGDLARQRLDGVIEYLGRVDDQVKIRGFRIELGEIEARLRGLEGVRDAAVVARAHATGKMLVAYVVADAAAPARHTAAASPEAAALRDRGAGFEERLRAELGAHLPEYMVPAHVVRVDALPLTPSGKLDRKALPDPALRMGGDRIEPATAAERELAEIWRSVLKLEHVGASDNFFALGGDSITALQVVGRARSLGYVLSPRDVFQHQTVQALARAARHESAAPASNTVASGDVALTPIQRWFFERERGCFDHFNQALVLRPLRPLRADVLTAALARLVAHHDALRLRFVRDAEGVRQFYAPVEPGASVEPAAAAAPVTRVAPGTPVESVAPGTPVASEATVAAAPAASRLLSVQRVENLDALTAAAGAAQASLDLEHGPVLRAVLLELPHGAQRLCLAIHHLVVDAVSFRILVEDLGTLYVALEREQTAPLAPKTDSFQRWSEALAAYARSGRAVAQLDYWRSVAPPRLSGGPVVPLAWVRDQETLERRFGAELTTQLTRQSARAFRTRVEDVLLTALARAVCRSEQRASVLVQLEGHGREEDVLASAPGVAANGGAGQGASSAAIDTTRSVGWFTSLYPVRLEPASLGSGDAERAAALQSIKEQLRAVPDRGLGYGALRYLGAPEVRAALGDAAAPDITINYLGQLDAGGDASALFALSGESAGRARDPNGELSSPLEINAEINDGELALSCSFSRELHTRAEIDALLGAMARELEALVELCTSGRVQGLTPSDFPLVRVTQAELDALGLAPDAVQDIYPLSPMQQGLLFHSLHSPDSGVYLNQISVGVEGLDGERLAGAWQLLTDRHEIMRTGFVGGGQGQSFVQVVHARVDAGVRLLDRRAEPPSPGELEEIAREERERPFELERPPLQRLLLVRLSDSRHQLIWTHHHVLMDGWSSARWVEELFGAYSGQLLAPLGGRYRDYIAWLGQQDRAPSERFWKTELEALEEPTLLASVLPAQSGQRGHGQLARR
ncbi:MAG TPA: amino acid adenylation domain-containing protein, partial [Polyangiaceae bacterium]|nr:amino acid adenylation domain-containing protein [Polyangiaceae bacterium]